MRFKLGKKQTDDKTTQEWKEFCTNYFDEYLYKLRDVIEKNIEEARSQGESQIMIEMKRSTTSAYIFTVGNDSSNLSLSHFIPKVEEKYRPLILESEEVNKHEIYNKIYNATFDELDIMMKDILNGYRRKRYRTDTKDYLENKRFYLIGW